MTHFVELKQPNGNPVEVAAEQVLRIENGPHPHTSLIRDSAGTQEVQGDPRDVAKALEK